MEDKKLTNEDLWAAFHCCKSDRNQLTVFIAGEYGLTMITFLQCTEGVSQWHIHPGGQTAGTQRKRMWM